jgi:hypothetical protein
MKNLPQREKRNAGRIDPPITGRDSIPVLQLVHALYCSSETSRVIRLDEGRLSSRLGQMMIKV